MSLPPQVSDSLIFSHLEKILDFPTFRNSLILSGFLKFVVEETLAGRAKGLKEYTIGVEVLGKKAGYDPQGDASVRIHAGRLRKGLEEYYSGPGIEDSVLISIPKGTYVPVFSLKEKEGSPSSENMPSISRPTLAVLPFQDLEDDSLKAFADGLCDQICSDLGMFSELSVISYFSSRRMASQEIDLKNAGKLLDATFLVTGSIQSKNDRVRIRVQLIQSSSQKLIWTNVYEREKAELGGFALQDDIVRHVVNQIGGTHGIIFREGAKANPIRHSIDIKVYDAVHWYYYLVNDVNEPTLQKGLEIMKNTVSLDPNYALGWAILGETYVAGYFYGFDCGEVDPLAEGVKCGQKALILDRLTQHGYQTLGLAYLFQRKKKECLQIIGEWEKLSYKANGVSGGLGFCLIAAGEFERGYHLLCESIQINPYYPWWFNAGLSFYHFFKKDYAEALYWAEKIQGQSLLWELILKTACLSRLEQSSACQAAYSQLRQFVPDNSLLEELLGSFLLSEELVEELRKALRKAHKIKSNALGMNQSLN
ncbi:tetratricopeptide repeat protein [Algoriphagus taiwanensis]|uniref:TolB amino-terminal domain-containing protein n=1 Tax=Algoriphagus taiwanensis TaxID=1445656 RepID=A0ABQ6Q1R4_9BACT|nr:hypothetical protein Ataiwa_18120 [Algoriphagus taiwanensis]